MSARLTIIDPDKHWEKTDLGKPREGKWFCITRYGGFGDMIQTAAIFPALKKLGYNKLLGKGRAKEKLFIITDFASKKALEKVKKAGGEVKVLHVKKEKVKKEPVKKKVEKVEVEEKIEEVKEEPKEGEKKQNGNL